MENWITSEIKNEDLVLSSRIRIARNIKSLPFPHKLKEEEAKKVIKEIEDAFYTSSSMEEDFNTFYLWEMDGNLSNSYLERHLISPNILATSNKSAFILSKDETVSLMINEEDHLRLQCINAGMNIREAYDMADKIDDMLEEQLDFAFDETLGYVTACPTNVGTGLRASAMLHLPALTLNDEINEVLKVLTQVGMTIRGLYGEGSRAEGNIYQVSNQITLGIKEEDILNNLEATVSQIVNQERKARERLLKQYKYELEDKIYRSLGILENAVMLNSKECLDLMSSVRMGIEMGIIKDMNKNFLNKLLVETQSATLQRKFNRVLAPKERDIERANLVKKYMRENQ